MSWIKVDDGFWSDPDVLEVGNEAAGTFVRMLSYCGRHLTDGHIPADVTRFISCRKTPVTKLEAVSFIAPNTAGFVIPDYLKFNPSREQVEDDRRKAAERMRGVRANNGRTRGERSR